jgi:hypothetical protein
MFLDRCQMFLDCYQMHLEIVQNSQLCAAGAVTVFFSRLRGTNLSQLPSAVITAQ